MSQNIPSDTLSTQPEENVQVLHIITWESDVIFNYFIQCYVVFIA